jgi:hypothetical protein
MKLGSLTIIAMLMLAVGCSKKSLMSDNVAAQSDSNVFLAESAVSALQQAADGTEATDTLMMSSFSSFSCPTPVTPTVRCGGNSSATSILKFDNLGNGAGSPCQAFGFNIFGKETLEFNSAAACSAFNPPASWPAAGSLLNATLSNFRAYHVTTGLTFEAGTDAYPDYTGVVRGGGAQVQFNGVPGDRLVGISGYNRKLVTQNGRTIFNHSIYTEQPIVVNGTHLAGNRVANGTVKISHNLARSLSTVSLSDLRWANPACCFPTSGRVVNQLTGNLSGQFTVEFTATCGRVNFTDTTGQMSVVQLNSCR